jgi:hypothetical protein
MRNFDFFTLSLNCDCGSLPGQILFKNFFVIQTYWGKSAGQAHGPGNYFSEFPNTSLGKLLTEQKKCVWFLYKKFEMVLME